METTKVKLTLMVDKKANKVLFAEAEKDFVDFLFNLLSLPIATVIRLLRDASMFGCVGNVYQSLEILNEAYLQPNLNKSQLLKPHVTAPVLNAPQSLASINSQPMDKKLMYKCETHHYVTDVKHTSCPCCSCSMNQHLWFVESNVDGIVKNIVTYMVTDDLSVTPVSMISGVDLLQRNTGNLFSGQDSLKPIYNWNGRNIMLLYDCSICPEKRLPV
jgi:hypothetical protein